MEKGKNVRSPQIITRMIIQANLFDIHYSRGLTMPHLYRMFLDTSAFHCQYIPRLQRILLKFPWMFSAFMIQKLCYGITRHVRKLVKIPSLSWQTLLGYGSKERRGKEASQCSVGKLKKELIARNMEVMKRKGRI